MRSSAEVPTELKLRNVGLFNRHKLSIWAMSCKVACGRVFFERQIFDGQLHISCDIPLT